MKKTNLRIDEPCSASWTEMHGDDERRFCDHCTKHVHHLSAMTRQSARGLLRDRPEEGLCVRYAFDATGRVRFANRRVQPSAPIAQRRGAAALLATASMAASLIAGCEWPVEANAMTIDPKGDGDGTIEEPILMGEPMIEEPLMGEPAIWPEEGTGEASGEGSGEGTEEPCDPDEFAPALGMIAPDIDLNPDADPHLEEMGDVAPESFLDEVDTEGEVEIDEVTPSIDPRDEAYMIAGGLRPMPIEHRDPTTTLDAQEDRAADQLAEFGITLDDEEIVDEDLDEEAEDEDAPRPQIQGRYPLRRAPDPTVLQGR